jgi:phosphatidylglycerophosphate synthase
MSAEEIWQESIILPRTIKGLKVKYKEKVDPLDCLLLMNKLAMYSLSIIASALSVLYIYSVAEKVELNKSRIILLLSKRKKTSQMLAVIFFLLSVILLVPKIGMASGIIGALVLWTLLACAVLLLVPFHRVKTIHLLSLSLGVILFELILNLTLYAS